MRGLVVTLSICIVTAAAGGGSAVAHQGARDAAPRIAPARVGCAAMGSGALRIAYAAPEAGACCGDTPACARYLATTIIQRPHVDLRT